MPVALAGDLFHARLTYKPPSAPLLTSQNTYAEQPVHVLVGTLEPNCSFGQADKNFVSYHQSLLVDASGNFCVSLARAIYFLGHFNGARSPH
jgi:hypothetical protein